MSVFLQSGDHSGKERKSPVFVGRELWSHFSHIPRPVIALPEGEEEELADMEDLESLPEEDKQRMAAMIDRLQVSDR